MMRMINKTVLSIVIVMLIYTSAGAEVLEKTLNSNQAMYQEDIASQQNINQVDADAQQMVMEYRTLLTKIASLKAYKQQLVKLNQSQKSEIASLSQQMNDIDLVHQEIYPLMQNMMTGLEKFVAYDLPFLTDERKRRISQLQTMMDRADVTIAEKFRHLMEAYQIEGNYGRNLETYQTEIALDQEQRVVNILRVGRIALYFQTLDKQLSGMWLSESSQWHTLPSLYHSTISQGIRMARKQAAPALLNLPIKTSVLTQ